MAPEAPREQEQSIKARKKELFDRESKVAAGPRRRFSEYIAATPPAPLSGGLKAALWCVGAVVLLLFLATLLTIPGPRDRAHPRPRAEVRPAAGR